MRRLIIIPLVLILLACGTFSMGFEDQNGDNSPSHDINELVQATLAALTPQQAGVNQIHNDYYFNGIGLPAGLIYLASDGIYEVDLEGLSNRIAEGANFDVHTHVSPDGQYAVHNNSNYDDLHIISLHENRTINLTNTTDRIECCAAGWWLSQNAFLFGSIGSSDEQGPSSGYLSMVSLDGSEYTVLDPDQQSATAPAPSPNTAVIAYDRGLEPWLYYLGTGPVKFDLSKYGLNAPSDSKFGSPAWSPDGKFLAWVAGGGFADNGDWRIGIAIFDMEQQTSTLLHLYSPVGSGGWPSAPVWSPDGQWLAIHSPGEKTRGDHWAISVDGTQEHYLGSAGYPFWSPDSRWLIYTAWPSNGTSYLDAQIMVLDMNSGTSNQLTLPQGSFPLAWIPPRD
ncbi:MAG: hypothetical protein OEZ02_06885 [Anaerolineae bacterium]|nr:hypothetical protein [Anaerolineae bacterium]